MVDFLASQLTPQPPHPLPPTRPTLPRCLSVRVLDYIMHERRRVCRGCVVWLGNSTQQEV